MIVEQNCYNNKYKALAVSGLKKSIRKYLSKKKWYNIVSDVVFITLIVLLIIPSTRIEVTSFFIRITSFPPSTLEKNEQYSISGQTKTWQIKDMEGNQISFSSLNEKPVFLNFWATWCPPCVAELPGIIDLYKKYKDDVNFILVSNEKKTKVLTFAKSHNFDKALFYQNTSVPVDFSSQSIPTTFIINKDGLVVVSEKGAARWNSGRVEEVIKKLISE